MNEDMRARYWRGGCTVLALIALVVLAFTVFDGDGALDGGGRGADHEGEVASQQVFTDDEFEAALKGLTPSEGASLIPEEEERAALDRLQN